MIELDFNLVLESDNILLRRTLVEDYNSFLDITGDKSMWIYFTSDLSIQSELKTWIEQAINESETKVRLSFTIIDKLNNRRIGSTSFGNISYRDKRIEIGWTWISQSYQGKGVNQVIKNLMLNYCFKTLDFERVEFKTDVLNVPARKALLKLGAIEEGILRSHTLMTHGRRRDTIYYSILKNEWPV